jgi:amino acid transporter
LSAIAFLTPRLTYAQAERGELPSLFMKLHPVYGTPVFSIIFFAVVATTLAISGTFVWLVTVSVLARLASFVSTCLAVPILRRKNDSAGLRIPLGPAIPIAAVGFCIWLAAQASLRDLRDFFLACIAGAVLYVSQRERPVAQPPEAR